MPKTETTYQVTGWCRILLICNATCGTSHVCSHITTTTTTTTTTTYGVCAAAQYCVWSG